MRRFFTTTAATVALTAAIAGASAVTAAPAGASTTTNTAYETEVFNLVNAHRAKVGCPALRINATLQTMASSHSVNMATRNFFSHTDPIHGGLQTRMNASGYRYSTGAENISAWPTPQLAFDNWLNSSGHRRNIENCNLTETGVGHATNPSAQWGGYFTQVFGRPA